MEAKLGRKCTQSVRRETNIIIYFVTRCELALGVCATMCVQVCVCAVCHAHLRERNNLNKDENFSQKHLKFYMPADFNIR